MSKVLKSVILFAALVFGHGDHHNHVDHLHEEEVQFGHSRACAVASK